MISISEVKKLALSTLKNRWLEAIGALFIVFAVYITYNIFFEFLDRSNASQFITVVFSLLYFVVSTLLGFGSIRFFVKYTRSNDSSISDIFHGFHSSTLKILATSIMIVIFIILWMLVPLIIGIFALAFIFSSSSFYYQDISASNILLTILLTIVLCIPGIIASIKYYFSLYILNDNPEVGIFEAIRQSKELIYGYKMKFFLFQLSFIGWAILSIISIGIGLIWLIPYYRTSITVFYNKLLEIKNSSVSASDFTL